MDRVSNEIKKIGMYGGSFNPLHNGHIKCIKKALEQCDELHLIIGNLPNRDDFDIKTKLKWFKTIFKPYKNQITLHVLTDDSSKKTSYTLEKWVQDSEKIKHMIGKKIDIVFCGSDYNRDNNPYRICYPEQEIVYLDRTDDNISSSIFKINPEKNKFMVPDIVYKSYLMKTKRKI
jgi:HTH-type transcriptional repressor of NAD biosynthesis genes